MVFVLGAVGDPAAEFTLRKMCLDITGRVTGRHPPRAPAALHSPSGDEATHTLGAVLCAE